MNTRSRRSQGSIQTFQDFPPEKRTIKTTLKLSHIRQVASHLGDQPFQEGDGCSPVVDVAWPVLYPQEHAVLGFVGGDREVARYFATMRVVPALSAVNRTPGGDNRAVDIQCQPSQSEGPDDIGSDLFRHGAQCFNLGIIKLTEPAGHGSFRRQLLEAVEPGDHGIMREHAHMGDTSSAGEKHGDQEQDESDD